jgi:hypothetical protein
MVAEARAQSQSMPIGAQEVPDTAAGAGAPAQSMPIRAQGVPDASAGAEIQVLVTWSRVQEALDAAEGALDAAAGAGAQSQSSPIVAQGVSYLAAGAGAPLQGASIGAQWLSDEVARAGAPSPNVYGVTGVTSLDARFSSIAACQQLSYPRPSADESCEVQWNAEHMPQMPQTPSSVQVAQRWAATVAELRFYQQRFAAWRRRQQSAEDERVPSRGMRAAMRRARHAYALGRGGMAT